MNGEDLRGLMRFVPSFVLSLVAGARKQGDDAQDGRVFCH